MTEDYDGDILSWWNFIGSKEKLVNEDKTLLLCLYKEIWVDAETRLIHRENGPAIISYTGAEKFIIMGRFHRLDGPAICDYENNRYFWYFRNKRLSEGKSDMLTRWWRNKCPQSK